MTFICDKCGEFYHGEEIGDSMVCANCLDEFVDWCCTNCVMTSEESLEDFLKESLGGRKGNCGSNSGYLLHSFWWGISPIC